MAVAMEELYPEELRTPPMPLAALVGLPELHSTISTHLHMEPLPINTLALPDFSKIAVLAGKEHRPADARLPPPLGILKVDWLWKHRTRVPAALVVLLSRDEVYGEQAQWLQVCTQLDNIKNVIHGRNTKLIIVIVQPTLLSGDAMEERMLTLRKRAEVDAKCFLTYISQEPSEQKRSLARLGNILGELMTSYYKEEGRRIKLRLEKKAFSSNELSVRYNFKVAVYAEFRRDWVEALKYYESAYTLLQKVVSTPMELQPVQRLVELKTVAEQLHFKVSTLLLHGGKEGEAVKWFKQHMSFYKPLVGPSEGSFLHWSWVSKQFLVFGVLLQNSLTSVTPAKSGSSALLDAQVTDRELQPGYYYQLAAHYMIQKRQSFQLTSSTYDANNGDVLGGPPEEVASPQYIGQSLRILSRGTTYTTQSPTDEEYMLHAVIEEKLFPHSATAINLLKSAYELYKTIQAGRMGYFIACEMGREYFNARDYINAKKLFDTVAGMYRQESWIPLLWATLGFLRECARQLGHLQEYIEYSLEMAALPTSTSGEDEREQERSGFNQQLGPAGPFCHFQREHISSEVFNLLHGKQSVLPPRDGEAGLTVVGSDPVLVNIDVASPLRAVLAACVAFHESTVKPGTKATLTLSLLTHLPQRLEFEELEVRFNQPACNLILVGDTHDRDKEGFEVRKGFDLHLEPNRWTRFSFDMFPGQSGKLECLSVTAHLGASTRITCQVESPASRDDVIYWKLEPQIEMMPLKDSALSHYGQKTIQVEEQDPMVDLVLEAVVGPALVNELFPINICIKSKGHSVHAGEVKFSIAEASTTTLTISPRTPSIPLDMSFIELLVPGPSQDATNHCELELLSGVMYVPAIAVESSFSTQMYMRWKEAKSISLFASFSYQTESVAALSPGHPLRYFVYRGMQLECEEPFTLSYRYLPPFRRDALLLGSLKKASSMPLQKTCVPINEVSTLVLTVKNSSSVNMELIAITVEEADASQCLVRGISSSHGKADDVSSKQLARQKTADISELGPEETEKVSIIMPGETFTSLYYVQPTEESKVLPIGTGCIKWRRSHKSDLADEKRQHSYDFLSSSVCKSIITLPPLQVEKPAVLATFHCPPHAVLGVPFDISLGLQNLTSLIQEIDFSVVDSTGFILSGAHSDSIHILPQAEDVIFCKLVPIVSGPQQLPQFNLTAKRYNAGFQQSLASIFVFPSANAQS